ncbi:adenosine kinase [Candidatus Woesearchaeota archaeon]|nr:adenosine kinase [Candidatus Woesearchaeota archaeon]
MTLDLMVLNNAVTDVVYEVNHEELSSLRSLKSSKEIIEKLKDKKPILQTPAGSPGNVGFSAAALGLKVGINGTLGNDNYAEEYRKKVKNYEIRDNLACFEGESGVCYTFITPDKERHFNAMLNCSVIFDLKNIFFKPKIIHTSAYEIKSDPEQVLDYLKRLKESGSKISLDLADYKLCEKIRAEILPVIELTDILFTSHEEYRALFQKEPRGEDFNWEITCLKKGIAGSAVIPKKGMGGFVLPIYPANLVNTNGAGDAYAAGFLYGYTKKLPLDICGRIGSAVAAQVCSQVGACLEIEC